jgi:hypothetical protein
MPGNAFGAALGLVAEQVPKKVRIVAKTSDLP